METYKNWGRIWLAAWRPNTQRKIRGRWGGSVEGYYIEGELRRERMIYDEQKRCVEGERNEKMQVSTNQEYQNASGERLCSHGYQTSRKKGQLREKNVSATSKRLSKWLKSQCMAPRQREKKNHSFIVHHDECDWPPCAVADSTACLCSRSLACCEIVM